MLHNLFYEKKMHIKLTFSISFEYISGFIIKYKNLCPNNTTIIVVTFIPLNTLRLLLLLYLIRILPLCMIEKNDNISGT